jgi:hypothetical protein
MSIIEIIICLVEEGRLIERPSSLLKIQARSLYVTPELDAHTMAPFADTLEGERFASVAQYFDAFSELNMITVSENPHRKPWDVMLARVDPVKDEFWSMRIVDPEETAGIRVLGGFCAKDSFVALTWDFRDKIKIGDFNAKVEGLKEAWGDYFGVVKPYSGSCLDDYLTNYDEQ